MPITNKSPLLRGLLFIYLSVSRHNIHLGLAYFHSHTLGGLVFYKS